jgi:hypothetical protein
LKQDNGPARQQTDPDEPKYFRFLQFYSLASIYICIIKKEAVNFQDLHKTLVARILEGHGTAPNSQRQAAYANAGLSGPLGTLIDKVARCAWKVTDEDIAAVKTSGASEDQIFELVVCSAVGAATRQYEGALRMLDSVTNEKGGAGDAA